MENLFITIVCIALILLATVSYATSSLDSADMISNSFKTMLEKAGEISRTEITATGATNLPWKMAGAKPCRHTNSRGFRANPSKKRFRFC